MTPPLPAGRMSVAVRPSSISRGKSVLASILSRSVTGTIAVAVTSVTLSYAPAAAAPAQDPSVIATVNAAAQDACRRSASSPADLAPTETRYAVTALGAGTTATLATVDVVNDLAEGPESCTFAIFTAPYSSGISGLYRLQVREGGDPLPEARRSVPFSPRRNPDQTHSVTSTPVFSDAAFHIEATLTVTGKVLTEYFEGSYVVTPTPKTAHQVKAAKKKYQQSKAKAHTSYKKAVKKAGRSVKKKRSAQDKLRFALGTAKQKYRRAVATSKTKTVYTRIKYETPVNASVRLDLPDDI